jgi:hypothetical protein
VELPERNIRLYCALFRTTGRPNPCTATNYFPTPSRLFPHLIRISQAASGLTLSSCFSFLQIQDKFFRSSALPYPPSIVQHGGMKCLQYPSRRCRTRMILTAFAFSSISSRIRQSPIPICQSFVYEWEHEIVCIRNRKMLSLRAPRACLHASQWQTGANTNDHRLSLVTGKFPASQRFWIYSEGSNLGNDLVEGGCG